MRFPTDKAKIQFGNQINTLVEGTHVIESNCIFSNFTREINVGIIFLSLRTSFRINYYAITSRPAPFSTQLLDNENIGGKGTFITCYSVKLRYCASRPPGLIEIIFDINNSAFIAFAIIIVDYVLSRIYSILSDLILKFVT